MKPLTSGVKTRVYDGDVSTPPKYQAAQQEREALLKLEDRLEHFVNWLKNEKCCKVVCLETDEIDELIKEYVET